MVFDSLEDRQHGHHDGQAPNHCDRHQVYITQCIVAHETIVYLHVTHAINLFYHNIVAES